jgi:cytochrome b561
MPATGLLFTNFGRGVTFFGIALPQIGETDADLSRFFRSLHGWLPFVLLALIALHAMAAAWHGWWRRDATLARMWPARQGLTTPVRRRKGPDQD